MRPFDGEQNALRARTGQRPGERAIPPRRKRIITIQKEKASAIRFVVWLRPPRYSVSSAIYYRSCKTKLLPVRRSRGECIHHTERNGLTKAFREKYDVASLDRSWEILILLATPYHSRQRCTNRNADV